MKSSLLINIKIPTIVGIVGDSQVLLALLAFSYLLTENILCSAELVMKNVLQLRGLV